MKCKNVKSFTYQTLNLNHLPARLPKGVKKEKNRQSGQDEHSESKTEEGYDSDQSSKWNEYMNSSNDNFDEGNSFIL